MIAVLWLICQQHVLLLVLAIRHVDRQCLQGCACALMHCLTNRKPNFRSQIEALQESSTVLMPAIAASMLCCQLETAYVALLL